jgi:UDP-N-acetylglucosamine 4,6-dehydratase/5-epimerase
MSNQIFTITGGTGSFGKTMLNFLLKNNAKEIRVFSRDENKQDSLRTELKDSRIKFIIGDTRDSKSVKNAIYGSDYVFHAAALKQVPSCEFFPMQAVATNISGSENVIQASIDSGVKSLVCLSTDKAVYPINAMGMTKAVMEKVVQAYARDNGSKSSKLTITRYGNVMLSRGSVIPLFINQIINNEKITVTDLKMTRFMMSLSESVDLVIHAFANGNSGDLYVRKSPASTVETLIEALGLLLNRKPNIQVIGIRHGEKMHEVLVGAEENNRAEDEKNYFRIPIDARNLDYQVYFEKGQSEKSITTAYTSENTNQLNTEQLAEKIENLPEFQIYIKGLKIE